MIRMQHARSETVYEFISVGGLWVRLCEMSAEQIMVLCLAETIYSPGCSHTQHKYLISTTSLQESDVLEVEDRPHTLTDSSSLTSQSAAARSGDPSE